MSVCGPGVVSGEAAQKVLSDHNVNFITQNPRLKSSPSVKGQKTPAGRGRPPAAKKLLRKGLIYCQCLSAAARINIKD